MEQRNRPKSDHTILQQVRGWCPFKECKQSIGNLCRKAVAIGNNQLARNKGENVPSWGRVYGLKRDMADAMVGLLDIYVGIDDRKNGS